MVEPKPRLRSWNVPTELLLRMTVEGSEYVMKIVHRKAAQHVAFRLMHACMAGR